MAILQVLNVHVVGFERMKHGCHYFGFIYGEIQDVHSPNHVDFIVYNGYLFRGYRFCIPCIFIRDLLICQLHGGVLVGNLVRDKPMLY